MYTVNAGDELEIRMFLDPRNSDRPHGCEPPRAAFDREIARRMLGSDYKLAQSIDIYSPDTGRKQVNYVDGIRTTTEWVTKTKGIPVTKSCESGGYRIAFNHETVSGGEQKITNSKFVRLKVRASAVWQTGWRFDFTLVKNATLATMQTYRETFITPGDFFSSKSWDLADWVECEFERTASGPVTVDDALLHNMYESLLGWQPDNEHNEWIRWLTPIIDPPQTDVFLTPGNMRLMHKFQRMLPRAREITVQEWRRLYHDCCGDITVRDKIDGERHLVVVRDRKTTIFRGGAVDLECKIRLPPVTDKLYIFDTEYLNGKWYVLHALYVDDVNMLDASDAERKAALETLLSVNLLTESDLVAARAMISDRDGIKDSVMTLWRAAATEKTGAPEILLDGLLVTLESQQGYWDQKVIKWKPPHEVTIDFVPIKCPQSLLGKIPYVAPTGQTLYILMVGCPDKLVNIPPHLRFPGLPSTRGYRLVPFCPPQRTTAHIYCDANASLEGFVIELIEHKTWQFKKIRTDKRSIMSGGTDMGNNIVTAQDTYSKYFTPFRIEDLYGVVRYDRTTVPAGVIPADCKHLILYRPPASLAPPRGIPHMLIVGPTDILGIQRIDEPRGSRVELPTAFIGGSPLVISYEIAPSGAKRWGRVMNIVVANGGTVVHLAPGEIPDCGLDFKLLKSPGGDEKSTHNFATWRRLISGTKSMTVPEMHAENPHTVGNPEAGYAFKYSRQKTRDIMSVSIECKTSALVQDPRRGEMLCYIEFLTKSQPGIQIYLGAGVDTRIKKLFPTHNFTDDPTKLELLIARTWDRTLLEKLAPRECLIYIEPGTDATFQMPKAKVILIPYQRVIDTGVFLHVQGSAIREKWWTCQRAVWIQEMKFFHNTYRPSGFRSQEARPAELEGFDSCYDCRSELYVLSKYCKLQKADLMDTIESF